MESLNQNKIRAHDGESNIQARRPHKSAQWHYTAAGAAILVIIILHFVSQFMFFQSEKTSQEIEAINHRSVEIKPEIEPSGAIETEGETKKPEVADIPNAAPAPVVQPQSKPAPPPSRVVIKKKEPRESRAERLRRAEKLLTGI